MKYQIKPHALQNGFTTAIHLAEGNQKLIAEVRGAKYARLICAAPELLEALERLSTCFGVGLTSGLFTEEMVTSALNAITEAKGE